MRVGRIRVQAKAAPARQGSNMAADSNQIYQASSQRPSGPAGGASDGYGLGRGAAGPGRLRATRAAGALRVIV